MGGEGSESAEDDRRRRAEAGVAGEDEVGAHEEGADGAAADDFGPAAAQQYGNAGGEQKTEEDEGPAGPQGRGVHDCLQLAFAAVEAGRTVDAAEQFFEGDQPRHVVVVGRQSGHDHALRAVLGGEVEGEHGQYGEADDAHAQLLAHCVELSFEFVRVQAADVQRLRQIEQEARLLVEVGMRRVRMGRHGGRGGVGCGIISAPCVGLRANLRSAH